VSGGRRTPPGPSPRQRRDPLRSLAKSMMRCGWAMGLMGWQAATGSSPGAREARQRRFDDAAHAAEGEVGEYLGEVYRTGAREGDRMIDGMAELGAGTPLDPRRFARALADVAERAGETLEGMAGRPGHPGRGPRHEADDATPEPPDGRGHDPGGWP